MTKITHDIMRKIREVSILDVADRLHVDYSSRGWKYRMCRCFMHDDRHPSMWIKPQENKWRCEVCAKGGSHIDLVMEHEGLSFADACQWFVREFNIFSLNDHQRFFLPKRKNTQAPRGNCVVKHESKEFGIISDEYLTLCRGTRNTFCHSLVANKVLTAQQMEHAAEAYKLGTTNDGGVIFWQIDEKQRVRDGKIMFYQEDCHRCKMRKPSWVSYRLIRKGELPHDWKGKHCLFGLHLVTGRNDNYDYHADEEGKVIAIVESEKTAIICSEIFPCSQERKPITWLATGGMSNLSIDMLAPLVGYKVIIFPDTDTEGKTYKQWREIAKEAQQVLHHAFYVSDILEREATMEEKERKIDIADFLLRKQKLE